MSRSRCVPLLLICGCLLLAAATAPRAAGAQAMPATPHGEAGVVTAPATGSAAAAPGDVLWARVYAATPQLDTWECAAVGPDGSLYVAGRRRFWMGAGGLMVARYNPAGSRMWTFIYGLDADDSAEGISVDRSGNAFVVGTVRNDPDGQDMLVLKLSSAGAKRWEWRLGNVGYVDDEGYAVTVDRAGNAYVAGSQTNPVTGQDAMVLKLSPAGVQRYRTFYKGPARDVALGIAVDAAGQAYVCGRTDGANQEDILLMKLSAAGSRLWKKTIDGSSHQEDGAPGGLALQDGNVYVAGYVDNASDDVLVAKYSSAGVRRWLRTYDGPAHGYDAAFDVAVGADGAVYVAGQTAAAAPAYKGLLVKWDAAGNRRWVRRLYNTADAGVGRLDSLALGPTGAVYCCGMIDDPVTNEDALVAAYSPGGTRRWLRVWDGAAHFDDAAECVLTGRTPAGAALLYACGSSHPTAAYLEGDALAMRLRP